MKNFLIAVSVGLLLVSCETKPKEWSYKETIPIEGVNPIGIANANGELWLSDGDHNRLVLINAKGEIEKTIDSLDRPMHIDASGETLFIPQYGNDQIATFNAKGLFQLQVQDSLDAPAGIGVRAKEMAIADFYNNSILYNDGTDTPNGFLLAKKAHTRGILTTRPMYSLPLIKYGLPMPIIIGFRFLISKGIFCK